MALFHYKIQVGIFVASVQAENWQDALKKVMDAELANGYGDDIANVRCIEVRRIRGKNE